MPSTQQTQFTQGASSQPQVEEEVVEVEEQPVRRGKKATRKTKDAQTGRANWTKDEEVALAEAWCGASTNSKKGNSQNSKAFWEAILVDFHKRVNKEPYRNNDGLSGKWSAMNKKITKFNNIYNKLNGQKQQSGTTEFDVYKTALEQYQLETKQEFTSVKAWEVVRKNARWIQVNAFKATKEGNNSMSKRSKSNTSTDVSDARTHIDLNEDNDEIPEIPDVEPLRRPVGRDKARRAATQAASSQSSASTLDFLSTRLSDHLELQKERVELKKRHQQFLEEQEATRRAQADQMRDLEILRMKPDDYEGENREAFLAMQRKIRDKYM